MYFGIKCYNVPHKFPTEVSVTLARRFEASQYNAANANFMFTFEQRIIVVNFQLRNSPKPTTKISGYAQSVKHYRTHLLLLPLHLHQPSTTSRFFNSTSMEFVGN